MFKKINLFWFFVLPTIVILILLIIYPMFFIIDASLRHFLLTVPGERPFIGGLNYKETVLSTKFLASLKATGIFVGVSLIAELILGFGLAILLNRDFPGKEFVRISIILPMALVPVGIGLIFRFMYHPNYGLINYILRSVGINKTIAVGEASTAMWAIIAVDVWHWTSFVFLLLSAGLMQIPSEIIEAAQVDGASRLRIFMHISLPLLSPIIMLTLVFRTMDLFKEFDEIFVLTAGGPGMVTETLSIHVYRYAFILFDIGKATAVAWIMLVIILAVSNIYVGTLRKRVTA